MREIKMGIADDIMAELANRKVQAAPVPKASAPEVTVEKQDWHTYGEGKRKIEMFSEVFWEPRYVPDHPVSVFSGYEHPEVGTYIPPKVALEKLSFAISADLKVNVVGPTGAGKTLLFEHYAAVTGRPYLRIEHNMELDKATVFGQVHINVDEEGKQSTDFVEGVLPKAMRQPCITNLDELSRAPGFANILYQRVLDRRELSLTEVKGGTGVLQACSEWVVCASDNTKGNGDDMDKYSASNVQDAAFINRWDVIIEMDYLNPEEETTLITTLSGMPKEEAIALAKFSALMHSGFKSGQISSAFSPRNLSAICKMYKLGMPVRDAVNMNYVSRASKSEISDIMESLAAVFGR